MSPGFSGFPDLELEAIYEDQVRTFTNYQTRLGVHAIEHNPNADLVMIYFEQPDGSGHQFTLTDRRQATNPLDTTTIGRPGHPPGATGQDAAKIARYRGYLNFAYQAVNDAVETIVQVIGVAKHGAATKADNLFKPLGSSGMGAHQAGGFGQSRRPRFLPPRQPPPKVSPASSP